jgi:hypothetical protein
LAQIVKDIADAEGEALAKLAAGDANALRDLLAQANTVEETAIDVTSTERNNQGVSSTWDSVKNAKSNYIVFGDFEIRLPAETIEKLSDYLNLCFVNERKPIHETMNDLILSGLRTNEDRDN